MEFRSKYPHHFIFVAILTFHSWELGYDLVVTLESAVMKFSLEIDGESLGSVDAKYN